ncbi:HAD family hydrolase [Leptotrichia sp. HSP-536]|uniref:HAD family hydrolase n=1 Tax=Leptotrichia alba TaxID=3239304 RepID=A0AB39V2Q0_9FUSO
MENINSKKIRNIVFDLGNVLIKFDKDTYLEEKLPKNKKEAFYNNVLNTKEWLMLDRGTLTYPEAKKIFKERAPYLSDEIDNFFDKDFFELLLPIKENIELLYKLRNLYKYKLYVLSNFHKDSFEYVFEHNDFFKLFEGCLVSCYFSLLKPEEKIYDTLLYEFGLNSEETLFIDDMNENIEACEKKGMNGLYLPNYTKLNEELEKILKISFK